MVLVRRRHSPVLSLPVFKFWQNPSCQIVCGSRPPWSGELVFLFLDYLPLFVSFAVSLFELILAHVLFWTLVLQSCPSWTEDLEDCLPS